MLTPLDIEKKKFSKKINGYSVEEVDDFLDELTLEYERLYRENAEYKEQLEQLRDSIILKYELTGENLTLERLAKEIEAETTWIKRATANTDKDINNEDIIVITTDGYIFQLYYNESYGQKFVEYLGREDGNNIPTVVARYSKETNKITVLPREDVSGIKGAEIIHKGNAINLGEGSTLEYTPTKTGWYIIRVTSNTGKLRYAWIRVSSTMIEPEIKIASSGEQENGWYGKDSVPVVVTIIAKGNGAKEIHYTTNRWETEEIIEGSTATLERNNKIRNNQHICLCSR